MTSLPSGSLGPYQIVAPLGRGGMGEVYRAHDTRLDRDVAVKLLPRAFGSDPDRLRRFEQEARAAAALNHPNILSVYDIGSADGVPYFVSELLSGETLRARLAGGRLPVDQATDLAAQIARGLAAAHDRGIVHRDLKPDNLFITTDGAVKILDFGIAKAASPAGVRDDQETVTRAVGTEPGLVVGTVPYMSPEQVRGESVDARSDIFALGAVLFEMLTGKVAFAAPSAAETMSAVLTRDPLTDVRDSDAWTGIPPQLADIVGHCLEKDPRQRFQSARDIAFGLEVLSGVGARPVRAPLSQRRRLLTVGAVVVVVAAIAVGLWRWRATLTPAAGRDDASALLAALPLRNLSGAPEDEYFTDGMTDSLITDLARTPRLAVIAREAVFRFKDRGIDPQKVGQELGARYVLHGSVQRAGDRVRINVRLVDVETGYTVWAEPFEDNVKDVFVIQNRIAKRVALALELKLAPVEAPAASRPPTTSEQAYDAYLRGLYEWHKPGEISRERALASFEQAVKADPGFALAQAALGSAYTQRFFYVDADRRWEQQAFLAIEKALALDGHLAEAYLARGQLAWSLPNRFPHERAVRDLQRAIELKPGLAEAHRELGKIYMHIGLLDKAVAANTYTLRLDPGNPGALSRLTMTHVYQGQCETALELSTRQPLGRNRALALACSGRTAEALEALPAPGADPADADPNDEGVRALLMARLGDHKAARERIALIRLTADNVAGLSDLHHTQYSIGAAYALMGETRQAVTWLTKASREGLPCYPLFERDPNLDSLRRDSEFVALLQELKAQDERFRATL